MGARSVLQILRSRRLGAGPALATAMFGLALAPAAHAEDGSVNVTLDQRGLRAESADGQFRVKIGGRLHADGTLHIGDQPANVPGGANNTATDGVEIRRGRLIVQATTWGDFDWVGEMDFADNEAAIKDFAVGYTGIDGMSFSLGHQKQPYSLDIEMSSNDIPFTERSSDIDFVVRVVDRAIGARIDANGDKWFFAGGFFGDSVGAQKDNQVEGWGATAKGVVSPIRDEDSVLHLGFRGAFRRPETNNESISFSTETTHMSNYNPVSSGVLQDVDGIVLFGPELAVAWGPVSLYGEYSRGIILRQPGNRVNVDAFHVAATYTLTGESRAETYAIESGEFKRIRPRRNFSLKNGGAGAWEVAVRYAYLDLGRGILDTDGATELPGGREQSFSAALNWYPNDNVRLMWNYRHILETDEGSANPAGVVNREAAGLNIFTTRIQFNF